MLTSHSGNRYPIPFKSMKEIPMEKFSRAYHTVVM
jgi:hypothetical protein